MIFRKQAFLGQIPLAGTDYGTPGANLASQLCHYLRMENENPGSATSQITSIWNSAGGVREREDVVVDYVRTLCPNLVSLLERIISRPKTYPAGSTPPPPVETPGSRKPAPKPPLPFPPVGEPVESTDIDRSKIYLPTSRQCYECGSNNFAIMTNEEGFRRGCRKADPNKCEVPHVDPITIKPLAPPPPPPTPQTPSWAPHMTTPMRMPQPPRDYRPWDPMSGRTMTISELLRAGLSFQPHGVNYNPLQSMPMAPAGMPVMNGPRVRIVNLGGSNEDLAWFEANRLQLAQQYPNQFVVIKDLAVHGAYPDFQSAYNAGVTMFGTQPFEVKQAVGQQPTEYA